MLKTSQAFALGLLFMCSSLLNAGAPAAGQLPEAPKCPSYVTIKDLRAVLPNDQYPKEKRAQLSKDSKAAKKTNFPWSWELVQAMFDLNTRYKDVPQQKEYLIDRYHRLTEEFSILKAKLKAAKGSTSIIACENALRAKDHEILSLCKSYQTEVGTCDIAKDAAPILEALEKLQNTKEYLSVKATLGKDFKQPLPVFQGK